MDMDMDMDMDMNMDMDMDMDMEMGMGIQKTEKDSRGALLSYLFLSWPARRPPRPRFLIDRSAFLN